MTTVTCECGRTFECSDLLDLSPPIPTYAWPDRWALDDGEGRTLAACPTCDAPAEEILERADLPDYPWK